VPAASNLHSAERAVVLQVGFLSPMCHMTLPLWARSGPARCYFKSFVAYVQ